MVLSDDLVLLRQVLASDVEDWLAGEDDEQIRWFEFPRPATRGDVERAIAAWNESWDTSGPIRQWGVCLREDGTLVGGVEVRDLGDRRVNLSYVVFPTWRRQGIATRAARLALSYARDAVGASCAVIKILERNTASLRVARALGAAEVGSEASNAGRRFVVFSLALRDS